MDVLRSVVHLWASRPVYTTNLQFCKNISFLPSTQKLSSLAENISCTKEDVFVTDFWLEPITGEVLFLQDTTQTECFFTRARTQIEDGRKSASCQRKSNAFRQTSWLLHQIFVIIRLWSGSKRILSLITELIFCRESSLGNEIMGSKSIIISFLFPTDDRTTRRLLL